MEEITSIVRVALLQAIAEDMNLPANMVKGVDLCRSAKGMGADIALFPEMRGIGYSFPDSADR
jgi:predicted amidohydrolase